MSLYVGLRCPEALAGIIALSGYLPLADDGAVAANGRRPARFSGAWNDGSGGVAEMG